jgi:hypothetical protein
LFLDNAEWLTGKIMLSWNGTLYDIHTVKPGFGQANLIFTLF